MSDPLVTRFSRLVDLDPEALRALRAITGRACHYLARNDLILEGDRADCVIVVLEGWACRYKVLANGSRQILAFLIPGDIADLQGSMLARMDHSIQTLTRAKIVIIPGNEMRRVLSAHSTIARAMVVAQIIEDGIMRAWITNVGRRTSTERVANLFCELHIRAQRAGLSVGNRSAIPLTQGVLADALAITAIHCNRVLKNLREKGIFQLKRGSAEFQDLSKLQRICGFEKSYLDACDKGLVEGVER